MTQDCEDDPNDPTALPLVSRLEIIIALVAVLAVATYFAARFFSPAASGFTKYR